MIRNIRPSFRRLSSTSVLPILRTPILIQHSKSKRGVLGQLRCVHGTSIAYDEKDVNDVAAVKHTGKKHRGHLEVDEFLQRHEKDEVSVQRFMKLLRGVRIPLNCSLIKKMMKNETYALLLPKIINKYQHSLYVRKFIVAELAKLSRDDVATIREVLVQLYEAKGMRELWVAKNDYVFGTMVDFIRENDKNTLYTLINLALIINMPTAAASILIDNPHIFTFDEDSKYLHDKVMNALLMENPIHEEIQLKTVIKLQQVYNLQFNHHQTQQIKKKVNQPTITPYVNKIVMSMLSENSLKASPLYRDTIYGMIVKDAGMNNPQACATHWRKIRTYHQNITDHDLNILAVLITVFTKNYKYRALVEEIITQLPTAAYADPMLVVPLLDFAIEKRKPDLANAICARIKPPVSRELLTKLLKLHVTFNDVAGSEKILQEIQRSGEPLGSPDYLAIVTQLLRRDGFDKALSVVQQIPFQHSEPSYAVLMSYIVDDSLKNNAELSDTQLAVIDAIYKTARENKASSRFWETITGVFFKYLCGAKDPEKMRIAKQIYLNSTRDHLAQLVGQSSQEYSKVHIPGLEETNPYSMTKHMDKLHFKITGRSKTVILKTIADGAIKIKDQYSLDFALTEMARLGFSKDDLVSDFSRKYSKKISKQKLNTRYQSRDSEGRIKTVDTLDFISKRDIFRQEVVKDMDNLLESLEAEKHKKE